MRSVVLLLLSLILAACALGAPDDAPSDRSASPPRVPDGVTPPTPPDIVLRPAPAALGSAADGCTSDAACAVGWPFVIPPDEKLVCDLAERRCKVVPLAALAAPFPSP